MGRSHSINFADFALCRFEGLWAVLHQYVTHNRYYRTQKQFADAILAFMRETIPHDWEHFRDKVSDNFRVITHDKFWVLE